jgi:hypothetical protein
VGELGDYFPHLIDSPNFVTDISDFSAPLVFAFGCCHISQLTPIIVSQVNHPSRLGELNAITSLVQLSAVKYVDCLSKIIPSATEVTFPSFIVPTLNSFIEKSESHQGAAGHLD